MKVNKIALGTAQFGMDYGINNKRGKIPKKEAIEILKEILKFGINTIDTAYSYGESETIIGEFIKKYNKKFKIISKLPECNLKEISEIFNLSLKKLNIDKFYGYLIHNFRHFKENIEIWNFLKRIKLDGKTEKIGFSLYFPHELEDLLRNEIKIDMIQVPYSIFDQRFAQYFPELKDKNIEIHVRSVFLQGLVFKKLNNLKGYLAKTKNKIKDLYLFSTESNIPVAALCLNFATLNNFINKAIVGIDSIENLIEIVNSSKYLTNTKNVLSSLADFKENDEKIILPINWEINTR